MSRITTDFGFESTAAQVVEGIDLTGKRAIVTGAASGIGIPTAKALADAGAAVTLAVRNTDAGDKVAQEIGGDVDVMRLELASGDSIDQFARAYGGPLDILVNNAGVMAIQELTLSEDGHELQFATNHLGHFRLTNALHGNLAAAGNARVVNVSSAGHLRSPVIFDDINFAFRPYDPWLAYGQSKTANVLLSVGITALWGHDGITSNALMPGGISTPLQRHLPTDYVEQMMKLAAAGNVRLKTPEQGAATTALLATSPLLEGIGGRYFEDCNEAEVVDRRGSDVLATGVARYAVDADNADRLWDLSEKLTGVAVA